MPVVLILSERQAGAVAKVATDPAVVDAIRHQLRSRQLFRRLDDAPMTVVMKRLPGAQRLYYAAVTFPDGEAADKAFDHLWKRTLADLGGGGDPT